MPIVNAQTVSQRLNSLRELMRARGIAVYVVPSADPHQGEYVPTWWRRREAISGFSGSMGTAVISHEAAWLWADSRYWLQAEKELDPSQYTLRKEGAPGMKKLVEWLPDVVKAGALGVDPRVISVKQEREWRAALERTGGRLELVDDNLVDATWAERPEASQNAMRALGIEFTGEAPKAKLARVQQALRDAGCSALVVTALDAVAWLFDVRGSDVDFNPVTVANAIVDLEGATLFVDPAKVSDAIRAHLPSSVKVKDYESFGADLDALAAKGQRTWIEPGSCSAWAAGRLVRGGSRLQEKRSPITDFKAMKNATEIEGMRRCHVRDGVAMVRFFTWLEQHVRTNHASEIEAACQLADFRDEGENFQGLSFETISAFAEHGAVVHYRPDEEGHRLIDGSNLYLVDSGAQYLDGTTDITRTIALGEPTKAQREQATRVLKGHVALARASFPKGTTGSQLDILARLALWEVGLNYGHGTGHGVGMFLNVHEGPQRIAPPRGGEDPALETGMILSNEPGYYEEGSYGIRIESLVVVVEKPGFGSKETFLGFETLTCCPIERKLIDVSMLTAPERKWVDDYHAWCQKTLEPFLDEAGRAWLRKATAAI
jgi:Xaa-Pro aminopeptidase